MTLPETLILVLYFFVLSILAIYGWHRYYLVYLYMKNSGRAPEPLPPPDPAELPRVTIQLPIFNEMYVADRLIDAVCEMDYPRELLEIQVLDDSTDETHGDRRAGGPAARRAGLRTSTTSTASTAPATRRARSRPGCRRRPGEFIAIFDADFMPPADFLKRTLPYFADDPKIGMVQARWGHINQDYSLLTKIQSILLDAHFVLEHGGRNRAGCFFNFNGTAGVWRREAIDDAGGWQHDTLTEDLDLSYRAQLRGWRFVFLPDVVAPAEVPVEMNSFKSQQHRWAKGSIQTCLKLLPRILRSNQPLGGEGRGVLPPVGELQLPADVGAVGPDVPGDVGPLQHGLDGDAAHRRAAVRRGDAVGLQLLHGVAARAVSRLASAAEVPAVPDVDRHRPVREQHARGARGDVRQAERVRADAEVRHRARRATSGSARSTTRRSASSRSSSWRWASTSPPRCSTRWPTASTARCRS